MDPTILVLVSIMLASGLLGGYINYLLEYKDSKEDASSVRSIVVGVGASLLVPLFLSMIASTLVNPKDGDIPRFNYLVFAGFCLIAAITSSAFIRTLSDKILNEVRDAKQELRKATEETVVAKEQLAEKTDLAEVVPMMYSQLYQDNGFRQTIKLGEQYVQNKGEPRSASFWTNLAAAYGQQHLHALESKDLQLAAATRDKALYAVKKALDADHKTAKPWLQFIWDPKHPGKMPEDKENDLEIFQDDIEFKELLGS